MLIPQKYQKSEEIDQQTISKFKSISNHYNLCLRKYIKSHSNDNFKEKIYAWLFSQNKEKRAIICSVENKWASLILHQLYRHQSAKKNLRFIPRLNEKSIPFLESIRSKEISTNKSLNHHDMNHFLPYYAMVSENYETNCKYNSILEETFLSHIIFYYPTTEHVDLENVDSKNYYPCFTLDDEVLGEKEKFKYFFSELSGDKCFSGPCSMINSNLIDIPSWAKQPKDSKLCFGISEIFASFFEQVISVYYLLDIYDKENVPTKKLEEFLSLKKNLEGYCSQTDKNLYDFLDVAKITKDTYYSSSVEKFVEKKKYNLNLDANHEKNECFWKENIMFDKIKNEIENFFANIMEEKHTLIEKLIFLNLKQLFTYEDLFLRKVFLELYDKYSISLTDDLVNELENMSSSNGNKKKKKKKKGKKNGKIEEEKGPETEKSEGTLVNQEEEKKFSFSFIKRKKVESPEINEVKNKNYVVKEFMGTKMFTQKEPSSTDSSDKEKSSCDVPEANMSIEPCENLENKESEESPKTEKSEQNIEPPSNNEQKENKNPDTKGKKNKKKEKKFHLFPSQKAKKDNKNKKTKTFMTKLNNDIIQYNESINQILSYLHPVKECCIEKIKNEIANSFEKSNQYDLELYGSYESGLSIESSDIDILFKPNKKKINILECIKKINEYFVSLDVFKSITPITSATVPVIKLVVIPEKFLSNSENSKESEALANYKIFKESEWYLKYKYDKTELDEIKIDISFPDTSHNYKSKNIPSLQVEYIKSIISKNNTIRITTKIMKRILKTKDLNSSYKGGLCSYSLFLLITAYYKFLLSQKLNKSGTTPYANFFVDMIDFYANFDFEKSFVNLNEENPFVQVNMTFIPYLEQQVPIILDPVTMQNAAKSSFNIIDVKILLSNLSKTLSNYKANYDNEILNNNDFALGINFIDELIKEI